MNLHLRPAQQTDIPAILTVAHTTIQEMYPAHYSPEAIAYFLRYHAQETVTQEMESAYGVVVEHHNEIVATGALKGTNVKRVFVLPSYQRQGIGARIMDHLEQEAARRDLPYLTLHASLPAKPFYEARTYQNLLFNSIPLENGSRLDYFCMARMLRPVAREPIANLNGMRFRVVKNDGPGAEVNEETRFGFWQSGCLVTGIYKGGRVEAGELFGFIDGNRFSFHYEQVNTDGHRSSGNACDEIIIMENGTIRIVDHWQWESRDGSGVCIMEQEQPQVA